MEHAETQTLKDEVAGLLEEEREALLSGNLEAVEALLPRKSALAERLDAADPMLLEELKTLRSTALRNQELLEEAMKGIQRVANRVTELRRVRTQLDTYDASGNKQVFRTARNSVERRA